jgi:UDP-2,4-diacetamido-2,4,6-trideoxy-beta-L-altropyranose hydrolase
MGRWRTAVSEGSIEGCLNAMKIMMRTDASVDVGHGHVMRCLTLATELRERLAEVRFVCRAQPGDLCEHIRAQGFEVTCLETGIDSWQKDASATRGAVEACGTCPDWLIVDHYQLDARWERELSPAVQAILVIDDLANRPHDCDLLLDQNYFPDPAQRYAALLPSYCDRFLGAEYVLLRHEFRDAAARPPARGEPRLLIFFGGSDPTGQSLTALEAALEFDSRVAMDVIVGRSNPQAAEIERRFGGLSQLRLVRHTNDMASLMARATLCLGAGGIATFERLYLGLPSIVVSTADNQREPLEALARRGCIEYLGEAARVGRAQWVQALERWHAAPHPPANLAVASRTGRLLAALDTRLLPFDESHIASTFEFLRDAGLRAAFAMGGEPEWERHVAYWRDKLAAGEEQVFAIERGGVHVGNCGHKPVPFDGGLEGWIYLSPSIERRSGLGELAFRRLIRAAFRERRQSRLYLHVRRDNQVALKMYEKLGFHEAPEPVDRRVWGLRAPEMTRLVIAA